MTSFGQTPRRGNHRDTGTRVLVLHWGRTGAGPRLARDLVAALQEKPLVTVGISYSSDAELVRDFEGLDIQAFPVHTYRSLAGALFGLPRALFIAFRTRRLIRSFGADAVVSPMLSLWQTLLLRAVVPRGVTYVSTIHDARAHPGESRRLHRTLLRRELRRADALVTMSSSVRSQLEEDEDRLPPIFETVHPAFSAKVSAPRRQPPRPQWVLGFFGRILPYKGLHVLATAVASLRAEGYKIKGVVAGSAPPQFQEESPDFRGLEFRLNWVPDEKVNQLVSEFDVLCLPYREASQSGALAVALAEGVPTVVSPVGGLVEQVNYSSSGIIAHDMSVGAFADALKRLLDDPELYSKLSANAIRAAATTFSWSRVANDYLSAIAQVQ